MEAIFVTGTDTNVGKSTICAGLLKMLHGGQTAGRNAVRYWKPVQTGTLVSDDTTSIAALSGCPSECFWDPIYRFPEPISPYLCAKKWGKRISVETIAEAYQARKQPSSLTIVEGAGGVLVPLGDGVLQIDLMKKLGIPVLVVAEDRLGAINHSLLTIAQLKAVGLKMVGLVLTKSDETLGNREAIEAFGGVEVLAQLPPWADTHALIGQIVLHPRLRKLFGLSLVPV